MLSSALLQLPAPLLSIQSQFPECKTSIEGYSSEFDSFITVNPHRQVLIDCLKCHRVHEIAVICDNKACTECRERLAYKRRQEIQQLITLRSIKPSYIVTQVFPGITISIDQLDSYHVKKLIEDFVRLRRKSVAKIRERKDVFMHVVGGYYFVESAFNWENKTVLLHLHTIYETDIPARAKPIDFKKMRKIWKKLAGIECQHPQALRKNSPKVITRATSYMTKEFTGKINGVEEAKIILQTMDLEDMSSNPSDISNAFTAGRAEIEQQLRYHTAIYNRAFRDQRRQGFFGEWYGHSQQLKNQEPWGCRSCGSQHYRTVISPRDSQNRYGYPDVED